MVRRAQRVTPASVGRPKTGTHRSKPTQARRGRAPTGGGIIPLVDLKRQYRAIEPEILRVTKQVLRSGAYILGPEVTAFEHELARYCKTRRGIGLASGTDALELALRACDIGPGAEVITTPLTFIATVEAIVAVGAQPVFADVDPVTMMLDPEQVARKITRRTAAIIPVHLYGQPANITALRTIARRHQLRLIEDCAQAIGATFQGRPVGSFGDVGCFSFYPAKNLGAYGDGGGIVTNNARIDTRVRMLRDHGSRNKYYHILQGKNSRLDSLQAAYLRVKLRKLSSWNAGRRHVAQWYTAAFRAAGVAREALPQEIAGRRHVYHLYVVRAAQRAAVQACAQQAGISTGLHYPLPLHLQQSLRWMKHRRGAFPHSERIARETISLPLYPEMTRALVRRVVRAVAPVLAGSVRGKSS